MGEYSLLINKKQCRVKLPNSGENIAFRAEVNGKAVEVELSEGINYDKAFFIKVDEKPYRIELGRQEAGRSFIVKVNGVSHSALLENKNKAVPQALKPILLTIEKKTVRTQAMALEKGVIAASMPGKVVLLRAKAGDSVGAGDVLLVLESMKMENEIASPISGVVKEVKVSEGEAVSLGEIMIVVSET